MAKSALRAIRRHHAQRLQKARRFYHARDYQKAPRKWHKVVDTPTQCSCWMCGNPRKYFKEKTVQERRQEQMAAIA